MGSSTQSSEHPSAEELDDAERLGIEQHGEHAMVRGFSYKNLFRLYSRSRQAVGGRADPAVRPAGGADSTRSDFQSGRSASSCGRHGSGRSEGSEAAPFSMDNFRRQMEEGGGAAGVDDADAPERFVLAGGGGGALVLSSGVPLAADAPVERPPAAAAPGLRELLAAQESGIA